MSKGTEKTELEKMLERKMQENNPDKHGDMNDGASADGDGVTADPDAPKQETQNNAAQAATDASSEQENEQDAAAETPTLEEQLEAHKAECDQLKDQLLRARADFDNYRKRMMREMDQVRRTASANLIRALLPALDNLERALDHADAEDGFVEGVRMVYKQFQETLAAEGLELIPAQDESFDPNVHDALATIPSDTVEKGIIVEEYERGYRLGNTVLRPSRVIVSSGPAETPDKDVNEAESNPQETADENETNNSGKEQA